MPGNPYYRTSHWFALRARALKRDNHTCTTPGCGARAVIVDHIKTRPNVEVPTPLDVITNLRSVCKRCDNQVKELNGKRRSGGRVRTQDFTVDGTPTDPLHHWASKGS